MIAPRRTLPFAITLFASIALPLAAQQPQPEPQPDPNTPVYTLQQTVQAVVLDIVVTDRDNHTVPGLSAKDFSVTEDKVPQKINLFQAPSEHAMPPAVATSGKTGDALVRASGSAPLTLLLLDEISTSPEDLYYARHQTADFLSKQPATLQTPTTLLALTGKRLRVLADYTTSRDQLLAAVKADKEPPAWYVLRDRQVRYETTGLVTSFNRLRTYLSTLTELAHATEAHPGRKNVIWIGPGLPALNSLQANDRTARDTIREAILRCSTSLLHARLTVSTVDPKGLVVGTTELIVPSAAGTIITNGGDAALDELSFEQLALQTGGQVRRMRNDVDAEIRDTAASGAEYYTLSYYPTDKEYNGKYRQIRVTLADGNLRAHTRAGYDALPTPPLSVNRAAAELAFALTSSLHYQAVGLSARLAPAAPQTPSNPNPATPASPAQSPTQPTQNPVILSEGAAESKDLRLAPAQSPATQTLHAVVDTADLHFLPDPANPTRLYANVTFVTAVLGREGKILSYHVSNMHATEPPNAAPNLKAEFLLPVSLPPRALTLRLLVRDPATGHIGSADLPLSPPGATASATTPFPTPAATP